MKALAVDAAQRYQSAGVLLEAIESFAVASRMSLSTMGARPLHARHVRRGAASRGSTRPRRRSQPVVREGEHDLVDERHRARCACRADTLRPDSDADVPTRTTQRSPTARHRRPTVLDLPRETCRGVAREPARRVEREVVSVQQPSLAPTPDARCRRASLSCRIVPRRCRRARSRCRRAGTFTPDPVGLSPRTAHAGAGRRSPSTRHGYASAVPTAATSRIRATSRRPMHSAEARAASRTAGRSIIGARDRAGRHHHRARGIDERRRRGRERGPPAQGSDDADASRADAPKPGQPPKPVVAADR